MKPVKEMTAKEMMDALKEHKISFTEAKPVIEARLKAAGFVQAKPLFSWIEKKWLDTGIEMGAIAHDSKADEYYLCVQERRESVLVGQKGRHEIWEERVVANSTHIQKFFQMYTDAQKQKDSGNIPVRMGGVPTF